MKYWNRSSSFWARFLKENGIGTEIYYPLPLHLQECFKDLGYKKGDLPESEEAAESVLSIPVFPELRDEQKEYVVQKISEFFKDIQEIDNFKN